MRSSHAAGRGGLTQAGAVPPGLFEADLHRVRRVRCVTADEPSQAQQALVVIGHELGEGRVGDLRPAPGMTRAGDDDVIASRS